MRTILIALALAVFCWPCAADVTVPDECGTVAGRYGIPMTLTCAQAKRARFAINRLDRTDPAVRACRAAIARRPAC